MGILLGLGHGISIFSVNAFHAKVNLFRRIARNARVPTFQAVDANVNISVHKNGHVLSQEQSRHVLPGDRDPHRGKSR